MGIISNFFGYFWFHDGPGFAELLDEPGLFKNRASTIAPPKTRLDNRVIVVAELGCVADIWDYPALHCDCVDAFLFSFLGGLCLFIPGSYRRLAGQNTPKVVCRPSISSTIKAQLYAHSSSVRQRRTRD